jgi:hypothetical protein
MGSSKRKPYINLLELNHKAHYGCLCLLVKTAKDEGWLLQQKDIDQVPAENDEVPICEVCEIVTQGRCRR